MGRRFTPHSAPIGDKLGPKIALLVKHVLAEHMRDSAADRAKVGTRAAVDFFKTITDERDRHISDLLQLMLGHEDTPEHVEKALAFIAGGRGELSALLMHGLVNGAVSTSIGSGLANILAPVNQGIMVTDPKQILDPNTMAQLAASRITPEEHARWIARKSGLPEEATELLIEAAHSYPPIGLLLELLRRREIRGEDAVLALRRAAIPEQYIGPMLTMTREHLAPADAALAVLRGNIATEEGARIAAINGIDRADFDLLVLNTGEPIDLTQLQEAYRRGYISEQRLEHGIRQSRVRNEWIDVVKRLRFSPASPSDALKAVVQNHLSDAEGKRIAAENGLDPKDWKWLVETEGNPLGPMQMVQLLRRGKMTRAEVEQGIRESRIKNKYIKHALALERQIPSLFQLNSLLKAGSLPDQEGARLLHELGYDKAVVEAIIHAAKHPTANKTKELAKAEIEELYYDHSISREQALSHLHALGLKGHDAELALSVVDLRREKALRQAAMSPIRTEYIARRIEAAEAKQKLTALGLPGAQVEFAVQMWTVDREAHTKLLSEAQIVKANKEGLINDGGAETRLMALGYHHEDAKILLDMEKGRTRPAP